MNSVDIAISFDTTGSMYPCLTQVRRKSSQLVKRLFKDIPNLRVAVIAHGDYEDARDTYVTKVLDFSSDKKKIRKFIENVEPTCGYDAPEAYELVLYEARSLNWGSGRAKVIVMIGDDVPHGPTYRLNTKKIDWRNELGLLLEMGINVYGVHAMPGIRRHSKKFYTEIAKKTGGFYLTLDQFATITDLIMAVCYKQAGDEQLQHFEEEIKETGRMNRNLDQILAILTGRKPASTFGKTSLNAVPAGRFQVMEIDEDCPIAHFVRAQGVTFRKGRGFYELTKPVLVQGYKEVILMDKMTGDLFSGSEAREMLDLPPQCDGGKDPMREDVKLQPVSLDKYKVFIQSTSANRKLLAGTSFLYEVEDWDRAEAA
jgi:hypothetical protein